MQLYQGVRQRPSGQPNKEECGELTDSNRKRIRKWEREQRKAREIERELRDYANRRRRKK